MVALLYAFGTAGFHQPDDHGMWGPSRAASVTTVALAVVVPLLLIVSIEVHWRCSHRTTVRWLSGLSFWTVVALYVAAETWQPAANVTTLGMVIAVVVGVLATVGLVYATRGLDTAPVPAGGDGPR